MGIPNNIADAAAAIKDGDIGLIDVVKIGNITVSALTGLKAPLETIITRKPIQYGYEITDAAIDVPREIVMDIILANPDFSIEAGLDAALSGSFAGFTDTWRDKRDQLKELRASKELITAQTHEEVVESMIVRLIDPWFDVNENADAYIATVYLSEIKVNTSSVGGLIDSALESVGGL